MKVVFIGIPKPKNGILVKVTVTPDAQLGIKMLGEKMKNIIPNAGFMAL